MADPQDIGPHREHMGPSPAPSGASHRREPLGEDAEIAALEAIVEGTAAVFGQEFFHSLARHLAAATGTKYAFVAEFLGGGRARTLAYWLEDHVGENVEWDLKGTPCEEVIAGHLCHHLEGVSRKFPTDEPLVQMGIESYLGAPLLDPHGRVLGHLAVFDDRTMPEDSRRLFIFRIFAARATAELLRLRAESQLKESEERFRDLFEEAPIAYVHEDLESRFIRANRAAIRILGITPDQVPGTVFIIFVFDNIENKLSLIYAF
jgi:PAS domain-containing protein